jgi:tuftelin-interacting protein 11
MDEEQHFDKFDVDNDYEGLQWIGGEAFFKAKRQKRQQTKDDQLYGVFADNSSDEDDRPRRKKEKEAADYLKPVSFVSKGVIQKEDQQEAKQAGAQGGTADAAPAEGSRPGLGSSSSAGLGSSSAGLGSSSAGLGSSGARAASDSEGDDDDEHVVLPTAFGKR